MITVRFILLFKTLQAMTKQLLDLFGKTIPGKKDVDFKSINELAITLGYIIHPDVCNSEVMQWLQAKDRNYNSTFYKSWIDVISRNRFELFIDQLIHYATTYGTGHTAQPYIPNAEQEKPPLPFTDFKVIAPITEQEAIKRCEGMLFSGIAMKQTTIQDVLTVLDTLGHQLDIEKVKNKEAKMFLYAKKDLLPKDPVEMVRYMVYLATAKTLLIKDKDTIKAIKSSVADVSILIQKFGIKELAKVFYRFKPIFLAFKKPQSAFVINKLRRAANTAHEPMKESFFATILNGKHTDLVPLSERIDELNNFRKITLLQAINVRQKFLDIRAFGIRNQKLYMKVGRNKNNRDHVVQYLSMVYSLVYDSLIKSLKQKACTINIPAGVNITFPASEKSFIGNFPLGSSFDFSKSDNIVGINWREKDGARDLDLSLITIDGTKYGWNADYYNENNSIVYSGDMTSANPEATELYYASKNFTPAIVKVNRYSGAEGSKFKFFVAKEKVVRLRRDYMVDPRNIIVNVDCEMDSKEKQLGVITEDKFILAQFRTGKGRVSGDSITNKYTDYALNTIDCYVDMRKALEDAGFTFTDQSPEIDLKDLTKDVLIKLLS